MSIIDSAGSASYGIQNVYGKTTVFSIGDASNATVEIDAGDNTISGPVYGGYSNNATDAENNQVTISSGTIQNVFGILGGYSKDGAANHNTITMNDGTVSSLRGGYTANGGNVEENHIIINGGTIGGAIGGDTQSGNATGNTVTIINGTVSGSVNGGFTANGIAKNNTVTLQGGTASAMYGAISVNGDVEENQVTINGGSADNAVGGETSSGNATKNTVTIADGTIANRIIGGYSIDDGNATQNEVTLDGGNVSGTVYGGFVAGSGNGNATLNTVTIKNGTVSGSFVSGGISDSNGNATQNAVIIENGNISSTIHGGRGANATQNSVTLSGGTVSGNIYGGFGSGTTTDNTINLYGEADISASSLYGGNQGYSGNTLNIGDAATKTAWTGGGQCVQNLANFENIYFNVVPWWENKPALKITDGSLSDLFNTKVSAATVYFTNESSLVYNKSMTLLDASAITDAAKKLQSSNITTASTFTVGTTLTGTGTLSLDANGNVIYTVGTGTDGSGPDVRVETGTSSSSALHTVSNVTAATDVLGEGYTLLTEGGTATAASNVYGKQDTADVSGAGVKVDIGTKTFTANGITGGYSTAGDAENNGVIVASGTVSSPIYGGQSESGAAQNNSVTVAPTDSSATITIQSPINQGAVYGGNIIGVANANEVSGNTVNINTDNGGTLSVVGYVYGGDTKGTGAAVNNAVTVNGSVSISRAIIGGNSQNGNANTNTINMDGGTVGSVLGGKSQSGTANENVVNISGGTINAIIGGQSESGATNSNQVIISGGNLNTTDSYSSIHGGYSRGTGTANNNQVTLSPDTTRYINVYGGQSDGGNTSGNTVTINKGSFVSVYGGNAEHSIAGNASQNTVVINDGSTDNVISGYGFNAEENRVEVLGGSVGYVYGGYGNNTNNNYVVVTNGTVRNSIYGGWGANATQNSVTLSGGTVSGNVYGGFGSGTTTDNTINLYGGADISASSLYGGNQGFSGNTLNIGDTATKTAWTGGGQCVQNLANFENIHFNVVPWWEDTPTLKKPALTITDGLLSDLSNTKVSAATVYFKTASSISNNAKMTLLDASAITDAAKKLQSSNITTASTFTVGTTLTGTGTLSLDANGNVIYTVGTGTDGSGPDVRVETGTSSSSALHTVSDVTAATDVLGEGYTLLTEGGTATAASNVYGKQDTADVSGAGVKVDIGTKTFTANGITGGYSTAGDAENNGVIVASGTVNGNIYGGFSKSGNANKNTIAIGTTNDPGSIDIRGNSLSGNDLRGGYVSGNYPETPTGKSANDNKIYIGTGQNIKDITLGDGSYALTVAGGTSYDDGEALRNAVVIGSDNNSGNIDIKTVYGGIGQTAGNNTVTIGAGRNTGAIELNAIRGGEGTIAASGNNTIAMDNKVYVGIENNAGQISLNSNIVSGCNYYGDSNQNSVIIGAGENTGNITGSATIYGGLLRDDIPTTTGNRTATGNTVIIGTDENIGSISTGGVFGTHSYSNCTVDATGNEVIIGSGHNAGSINIAQGVSTQIAGSYIQRDGTLDGNIVKIGIENNSGDITIADTVTGVHGAYSLSCDSDTTISDNKVYIGTDNNNGTVTVNTSIYGAKKYDHWADHTTNVNSEFSGNKVYIGNTSGSGDVIIIGDVFGAHSDETHASATSFMEENAVNIYSGNISGEVAAARSNVIDTANNTLNILGGTLNGKIYGSYTSSGNTTNNTINLSAGTILGSEIYGGYSSSGNATDNTVNLSGTADISASSLYGGNHAANITGNTLNIGDAATRTAWTGGNQSVKNVTNFEKLHFNVIPWWEDTPTIKKPALTIADGTVSDLSNTKVDAENVYFTDVQSLTSGATMTVLDDSRLSASNRVQAANLTTDSTFTVGTTLTGKGALSIDENGNVIYTVTQGTSGGGGGTPAVRAQEQTHKTLMGMAASMATLAVGNDFIGRTLDGLADVENEGKDGFSTFAAFGGGVSKYETGSHIRANTWNAILGLGKKTSFDKNDKRGGFFEWGAFFEYGSGNYTTHGCDVRGDGSAQYTGGGLLAKWKSKNDIYVEGSVRAGSVTDKASNMLHDVLGGTYGYDTRANYLGVHVGLGKIYRFGDDTELDVYGKFFYTRRDGVSFDAGGRYHLDAMTSDVLRVGVRYGMTGKKWNWFGGLAYEYEFDGKATGTADGAEIRRADIGGGSLRGEVGVVMTPSEESPWSLRMSAEGYCGERQGFGGTLSLTYAF